MDVISYPCAEFNANLVNEVMGNKMLTDIYGQIWWILYTQIENVT